MKGFKQHMIVFLEVYKIHKQKSLCRADALQIDIELGLIVQETRPLQKRGLLLVSLDLPKFFDFVEWGLLGGLAEQFGLPAAIRGAFMRVV